MESVSSRLHIAFKHNAYALGRFCAVKNNVFERYIINCTAIALKIDFVKKCALEKLHTFSRNGKIAYIPVVDNIGRKPGKCNCGKIIIRSRQNNVIFTFGKTIFFRIISELVYFFVHIKNLYYKRTELSTLIGCEFKVEICNPVFAALKINNFRKYGIFVVIRLPVAEVGLPLSFKPERINNHRKLFVIFACIIRICKINVYSHGVFLVRRAAGVRKFKLCRRRCVYDYFIFLVF